MGIHRLAHMLPVPPTKACLLCATPAGMDLYIQLHARRHLLSAAVPWISKDRLLSYAHGYVAWLVFGITQHFVQKEEHKSVGSERMREGHHHSNVGTVSNVWGKFLEMRLSAYRLF